MDFDFEGISSLTGFFFVANRHRVVKYQTVHQRLHVGLHTRLVSQVGAAGRDRT